MASRFVLRPLAEQDITDIWTHGADRWGIAQADKYFDRMMELFDLLRASERKTKRNPRRSQRQETLAKQEPSTHGNTAKRLRPAHFCAGLGFL